MTLPQNFNNPETTVIPAPNGSAGLERNIREAEVATMPFDGREVGVADVTATRETGTGFDTGFDVRRFVTDDGCVVASILDVFQCGGCHGVLAKFDLVPCLCGAKVCLRCSKTQKDGRRLCMECNSKEWWKRFKRRLVGLFWVSRDE